MSLTLASIFLNLKSSSNWSIRIRTFSFSDSRICFTASTKPSELLRKTVAMIVFRISRSSSSNSLYILSLARSASARLSTGPPPGRATTTRQVEPACVINPPCKVGINPQYISEDLPLPEAPSTPTNLFSASLISSSSL